MGFFTIVLFSITAVGQEMTLSEAIAQARIGSVASLQARQSYLSTYWAWRTYQASKLPSVSLYGNLMNFTRNLTPLQDPGDGTFKYVHSFNLQNSLGVRLSQNIPFTGGVLSLYSDLNRIDEFGGIGNLTWYAQPVTLSYYQPLFSYNQFKWDKIIEPKEYELGRRTYLEAMEQVSINTAKAYFNLLIAMGRENRAKENAEMNGLLLVVAKSRMELGSVSRDEYLQLELRFLNDSLSIRETGYLVREAQMELNTLLGLNEDYQIIPVLEEDLPALTIDYEEVLSLASSNAGFELENELSLLKAHSAVERARAERGVSMQLNARFGLSNTGITLPETYRNPMDQEVVGLSFNIPIVDWGLAQGKVQRAIAAEEVVKAQVRQRESDYRRIIFTKVARLMNQRALCMASLRASKIAFERYELIAEKFRKGNASVMELNIARTESDEIREKHITEVGLFWSDYYELRKETLYDFMKRENLSVDEEELTGGLLCE